MTYSRRADFALPNQNVCLTITDFWSRERMESFP